jgi:glycosyltransferase involved in cell wall biosynthesis
MNKMIYILLATYNGEIYIREQLDSLLKQTYQNWILWIHDDGSKDATLKIVKEYKEKFPNKIILISDGIRCGGAKQNFTHLLSSIDDNYDYIMFCDQDDVWLDYKIELTLNTMIEVENSNYNKPIIIHTDLQVVDETLKTIANSYFIYQKIKPHWSKDFYMSLVQNSVTGCTMMINKKAKEISLPIGNNAIMHDWWILLKVLQNNGVVKYISEPTILYRQHSFNDTGAKGFSFIKLLNKINSFKKYKNMSDDLNISKSKFELSLLKIKNVLERVL